MSIPSPAIDVAASVTVAGCRICRCGLITVRLHDETGAVFAAFQMPTPGARAFAAAFLREIDVAESGPGLGTIRCEGSA